MSSFRVFTSVKDVRVREPGRPTTGPLWLMIEGTPFPQVGWNDFVVVVLEAMGSALARLLEHSSSSERFAFMEGPFEVRFQLDGDQFVVNAVEHRVGPGRTRLERSRVTCSVAANLLLATYLESASAVLDVAMKAGDRSPDCTRLAKVVSWLQRRLEAR